MLADFAAANYRAPVVEIIREAVREHIERRLSEEPKLRARYEAARRQRLGLGEKIVKLVEKPD